MAQLMSIKRNVEMCPGQVSVPAIYHVSQGDKGTRIILGLVNNSANYTIPEGTTATIRGHRADGTLFTEITADVETTEVKFNLTEDMSAVPGRAECEAVLASGSANIIGTANFIIDVEKSPASIGSVFPGTDAAKTWLIDELTNLDISGLDNESVVDAINSKASESTIAPEFSASASYTTGQYVYKNGVLYRFTSAHTGAWTGTDAVEVTVEGEIKRIGSGSGLTESIKTALLACFEKVAWIDEDGQDYYDALYNALYPPTNLSYISCIYTQSGNVYITDTLNSLKTDLVVTAHYSDGTTGTITGYVLSGTLTSGTSTITVSYMQKTTTFNVNVVQEKWTYNINDLMKLTGAFATNTAATCQMALNKKPNPNDYRRSFAVENGITSIAISSTTADNVIDSQTSEYYPIRIPHGAIKATISVTPSTQYIQALMRNLENGIYSGMSITGGTTSYQLGYTWKEFEPVTGDSYVFVVTKYNNNGTSYPTEPTEIDVVFE